MESMVLTLGRGLSIPCNTGNSRGAVYPYPINKMKFNPQIHHRRSKRLKGYDYSQAGAYFITICCADRKCSFGKIEKDEMILNEFGTIACNEWNRLPERFSNFELDIFQIMPNHMHGIMGKLSCSADLILINKWKCVGIR
jgi:hypothetical protein